MVFQVLQERAGAVPSAVGFWLESLEREAGEEVGEPVVGARGVMEAVLWEGWDGK